MPTTDRSRCPFETLALRMSIHLLRGIVTAFPAHDFCEFFVFVFRKWGSDSADLLFPDSPLTGDLLHDFKLSPPIPPPPHDLY